SLESRDGYVIRQTEARRALGHAVEHGLELRGRARDDTEDLARRRLLVERLGKIAIPRLQLLEQAYVLDRDDRLVGEGPQQLDLGIREPPGLPPDDADRTDRLALAQHRQAENAPPTPGDGKVCRVLRIRLNIRDVDDVSRQDRASGGLLSIRPA